VRLYNYVLKRASNVITNFLETR